MTQTKSKKLVIFFVIVMIISTIYIQAVTLKADALAFFVLPIIFGAIGAATGGAMASGGSCHIYTAPIGGTPEICEQCQSSQLIPCTEYKCRSLGQSCEYLSTERKCISAPCIDDTSPPEITTCKSTDLSLKPYATSPKPDGCTITEEIPEFSTNFIMLETKDYSRCRWSPYIGKKFDPADTTTAWFDEEAIFTKEHFWGMNLGNGSSDLIKQNCKTEDYCTFYVRCQDKCDNKMQSDYYLKFKVKPGPDLFPPDIFSVAVPSGVAVPASLKEVDFYMFVDDGTGIDECRYSKTDETFDSMPFKFSCSKIKNLEENGYECTTKFNLSAASDTTFYFRCQDNSDRKNTNPESYEFIITRAQALQFTKESLPSGIIQQPNVGISLETNNKALCYYSLNDNKEILFNQTDSQQHSTRIKEENGNYNLKIRCIDEAGNEKIQDSDFRIDYTSHPIIRRVYKLSNLLYIQLNQDAACKYSRTDRNFNPKDGVEMAKQQSNVFKVSGQDADALVYYIICKSAITTNDSPTYTVYP